MGAIHQALLASFGAADDGGSFPAFPSIASIWGWYEPDRETGYNDSDPIEPLTDQSGNGRHWTSSGGDSSNPQYKVNVINGLAVADAGVVAGAGGWNTGPNMSGLTAAHAFIVIKAQSDPAADPGETVLWRFGSHAPTPDSHIPYTDSNIYDGAFSDTRKTTGNPDTSMSAAFVVYEVISTSGEWTRKINGATSGNDHFTTATNTVSGKTAPELMTASRHKLAGLYIFSAKLSGGDRTSMIDYINTRFALSSS